MKKFFSCLLLVAITTSPMAFGKKTDWKEHNVIYHHHVLEPKLDDYQAKIEAAQSWKDMEAMLEHVTPEHKSQIVAQLRMLEGRPFKLPKLTQTVYGFTYEVKGKTVSVNFMNGEISVGSKTFEFSGKSPDDLINWYEKNAHTASALSWVISEAYAQVPMDLIYEIFLAVYVTFVVPVQNKEAELKICDTVVKEFHSQLQNTLNHCKTGFREKIPYVINNKIDYLTHPSINEITEYKFDAAMKKLDDYNCKELIQKQLGYIQMTSCKDQAEVQGVCTRIDEIKQCLKDTVKEPNKDNTHRSKAEKVYIGYQEKKESAKTAIKKPFKKIKAKVKGE